MEYPIDPRNKVKRVPNRGHYDQETVHAILDAGMVCHVSFVVDSQPFIIPTLYGRKNDIIYLHGASSSRLIRQLDKGIPMSLAVTHVDGIVLARSAFHHSMNYRSVVVFGTGKVIEGEEKLEALKIISDNILDERWNECRRPSEKELKATSVIRVQIDQASAKIRTGGPKDEPADYDLEYWAGVLPIHNEFGAPKPDEQMKKDIPLPSSVSKII